MAALDAEQIQRLHAAIVSARLTDSRTALLGRIDPTVVAGLPIAPTPSGQILSDLNTLNEALLLDGSAPMKTWLENAAALAGGRVEAQVFHELLGREPGDRRGGTLFLVPFVQNPSFVGRGDDLSALHALLQKGEAVGVRPAALTGMGGIGKTQLAVEYAYRYRDAYAGGVYWVNAAEDWQAEFARLAVDVGLGAGDAPEAERRRRLALAFADWLRARPGALVIFDNVEDPLSLRSPGPGFIAEQLGCRLLFTTRRRDPDLPFASIDVRVLPEDAALALLLSSEARRGVLAGGAEAELGAAKAVCRTLGYLPLAIVLAAAHLGKYPRNTVESYLGWLNKYGALAAMDAAKVDARMLATRHDAAVGATLRLSWDALKSDEAKRVLQTAALLGEAAQLPKARLSLLTGLSGEAEAWCAAPLSEALGELAGLSLVEELTEREIRLHPLVREFAESMIEGRAAFAAVCAERLGEALWDMGRLHDEVAARGVDAVLGDLRIGAVLADGGKDRFGRLIRPLDREAHCIREWDLANQPGFLLQQIRNRGFEMDLEDVQRCCEEKLEERRWPYLRERIRTSRESEALIRTLEGHTAEVTGVAVTGDSRYAISASRDGTLKVWDLSSGQAIRTLIGHTDSVNGVAVTSDGRHVISASDDSTLKVWDLSGGRAVHTLKGHAARVNGVAVAADSRYAVSVSDDRTLRVWDLSSGRAIRTLERHFEKVTVVAVTADGHYAVSASSGRRTLNVWDLWSGQPTYTIDGHTGLITGIAVTSDSRHAISASYDDTLRMWDLSSGHAVRTLECHSMRVTGVAVTLDGRHAISASFDNTLKVWDLTSGHTVRTLKGHTSPVTGIAVTADGRYVVSASQDRTLKVWDLSSVHAVRTLEGHTDLVSDVVVTSDAQSAVSASWDRTLKVWDLSTGRAVRTLEANTSSVVGVAVTADGQNAVTAAADHTLKVCDLRSGNVLLTFQGHNFAVNGVAVTGDGRHAISASDDRTLKVWNLSNGHVVHILKGHRGRVTGVAVTADDRFAVSVSYDHTLKVWDLSSGHAARTTLQGHTSSVNDVALTADGRRAVSASSDHVLKVWDLSSGQVVRTLEGHTSSVVGVAVTADGRHAVSASRDRTLKIWNLSNGQAVMTLKAHAPIECCAVTPDGKIILAGDWSGAVHILDWIHP